MLVRQIVDSQLAQFAYLVGCPRSGEAIVIDPERDIDRYFDEAARHDLRIVAAVDTHIHADYLSGLREMAERGVLVYASKEGGTEWQYEWLPGSSLSAPAARARRRLLGGIHRVPGSAHARAHARAPELPGARRRQPVSRFHRARQRRLRLRRRCRRPICSSAPPASAASWSHRRECSLRRSSASSSRFRNSCRCGRLTVRAARAASRWEMCRHRPWGTNSRHNRSIRAAARRASFVGLHPRGPAGAACLFRANEAREPQGSDVARRPSRAAPHRSRRDRLAGRTPRCGRARYEAAPEFFAGHLRARFTPI